MRDEGKKEVKEKWRWMMDYCKRKLIPPAHKWAWDEAEEAYRKEVLEND